MNKRKVPKIRFKGFSDDWEQRKLEDLCELITKQTGFDYSASIKPSLVTERQDDTYPFIQNKDFNGNDINMNTDFYIPVDVAEGFPKILLDKPSVLISISGRIGNVGFYRLPEKAFIGGAVGICKLKNPNDGEFIIHELESDYGQKYFQSLIKASSHANITVEDIRNIKLIFPQNGGERKQISVFLNRLDHLITLHQRKLEKLKIIKKSMLENCFPKNGAKVPKTRFSEFSDDWEQRKAKELFVSTADKGYPELPVLSATQDRGMIRRDENSINIFHDKKNEAGYKRVLPGQFVIHLRSFQGGFAHAAIEGITSPAYTVFGFSEVEKHDSEYWKYVFTSRAFIRRLETVTYGIRDGRSISYDEFLTLSFVYPSKDEQTTIAQYLEKLSHLITLHQSKLEKLKMIKKSMLETMFV